MTSSAMKPLRVRIVFRNDVGASAVPRMLDGLMAWCVTQEAMAHLIHEGGVKAEQDQRPIRDLAADLPFAFQDTSQGRIWKASVWMPVGRVVDDHGDIKIDETSYTGQHAQRIMTRKTDVHEIARLAANGVLGGISGVSKDNIGPYSFQFNTGSGLMKEYFISYGLRSVHAIEAWCIGDPDMIEALLNAHVDFVGPKRRLGHGAVASIQVTPDDRAERLWKLRPLPVEARNDDAVLGELVDLDIAPSAPYWARENAIQQQIPSAAFW